MQSRQKCIIIYKEISNFIDTNPSWDWDKLNFKELKKVRFDLVHLVGNAIVLVKVTFKFKVKS
jgi:hypothetical protein